MESVYSQQLLDSDNFPWGEVEEISQVGLSQKDGMEMVKGSAVKMLGVQCSDSSNDIALAKYKCRVSHNRARQEEDCIKALQMCGQMEEERIYCEVISDDPDRLDYIKDEKELCRILHHAFTYSK